MSYPLDPPKPITIYFISGVWFSTNNVTHYAVHGFLNPGVTGIKKMSKEETITLIETVGTSVYTWIWDYRQARFRQGRRVQCNGGKYINTIPADDNHKNLRHLVSYSWH